MHKTTDLAENSVKKYKNYLFTVLKTKKIDLFRKILYNKSEQLPCQTEFRMTMIQKIHKKALFSMIFQRMLKKYHTRD